MPKIMFFLRILRNVPEAQSPSFTDWQLAPFLFGICFLHAYLLDSSLETQCDHCRPRKGG
jgi:hypothetical protein